MPNLKPRARIIRTIGDQLISGPEAAIIELVKNSYDADAKKVEITFSIDVNDSISIAVADDGHGMTLDEISSNWLEPATDFKINNKSSRSGKRKVLGAKGIGRFAVSRLGSICLLTSVAYNQKNKKKEEAGIYIDWSQFTAEKYLDEIEIDIEKKPAAHDKETGVSIEITKLRDNWSKKQLQKLILELRRLVKTDSLDNFEIYLDITCFNPKNSGFSGEEAMEESNQDISEQGEESEEINPTKINPYSFSNICDYKLEGSFDSKGNFEGYFQIQRGDNQKQKIKFTAPNLAEEEEGCGNLNITLNIYDREHEAIKSLFERMGMDFNKIGIRRGRKIISDMSGVAIIRNGFRIRPYGDPGHDWLELQAKRVQDPSKKLGSDQVSGFVEIADEDSSGIIERSSREGLELNPQYWRLRKLIETLLPHIEERRKDFREKAGLGRKPTSNVDKARDAARLQSTVKALKKVPEEFREKLEKAIEKDSESLNEMLDEVDNYQKILQSRASLGLVVSEVIHEGRRHLNPMASIIKTLKSDQKHACEESEIGELYRKHLPENLNILDSNAIGLSKLFKKLDPVSGRKRGRPTNFPLHQVITHCREIFENPLREKNIKIIIHNEEKFVCYGYKEDLQAGLMNIIENAIHWLSNNKNEEKLITLRTLSAKSNIEIIISNNGPEIDESYIHRIFDAGFSLKSDGTGLGLAIAREACRASKGDISLLDDVEETTFKINFPRGKEQ